jgi:Tfp pilus assembly protein PilF
MLQEFPKAPEAWSAMATIAAVAGDTETAGRAFRTWLELAPADADAHANYAFFLNATGRSQEALAMLDEATRRFPGHGVAWDNYAVVLQGAGKTNEAAQARARAEALLGDEQRAAMLR